VKLTVVGCSGSFPGPDAAASCYLVEADDVDGRTWRVLLDLGSGALGPLQAYADLRGLDAVLLSHLHPDHCMDLCGLYVALRYDPRGQAERRVPVYGPAGTLERLASGYGSDAGVDGLQEVFDVRAWADGEPVRIGPLEVTPLLVEHPVEAYGLRLEQRVGARSVVLAYTGDTDACPALAPLARGADVLLAEASFVEGRDSARGVHLTGRRAGEAATQAGVGRLVLTHIPAWNDPAATLQEARSAYPGPVDVAHPGMVHQL
jgi:ribonuclease BN (tRNA processing enzyme)